jgi:urease accessory protein
LLRDRAVSVASLVLGDSRFPAGGHAYSGGVEPAVTAGLVDGLATLEAFLRGRLRTAGLVAASLAATACAACLAGQAGTGAAGESAAPVLDDGFWELLDAEADARTPAPAQRDASRRQGRALLRAARVAWPDAPWPAGLAAAAAALAGSAAGRRAGASGDAGGTGGTGAAARARHRGGPHHAVVLGAAAAAAGCTPGEAARIAAYQAVAGPVSAAVRLLALDPMRATGVLAALAGDIETIAEQGAAFACGPLDELPCPSAPALDLLAETHTGAEVRLFES